MKYYYLDGVTNTWSEQMYPLEELLFMSHLDDSTILSTETGEETLTLEEAKARKPVPPPVEKAPLFADEAPVPQRKKEYKVLSQKDKWYSGKFDPALLEQALNAYADMGYQVVCSSTATIQGITGSREEMVIIMERDKPKRYSITDGVAFVEGDIATARIIKPLEMNMDSIFNQTQLTSLDSVKRAMAQAAIQMGGNCIINFEYGQTTASIVKSIFSMDDIYWYGRGTVAVVDVNSLE